jgi:hypothetical protein
VLNFTYFRQFNGAASSSEYNVNGKCEMMWCCTYIMYPAYLNSCVEESREANENISQVNRIPG